MKPTQANTAVGLNVSQNELRQGMVAGHVLHARYTEPHTKIEVGRGFGP